MKKKKNKKMRARGEENGMKGETEGGKREGRATRTDPIGQRHILHSAARSITWTKPFVSFFVSVSAPCKANAWKPSDSLTDRLTG